MNERAKLKSSIRSTAYQLSELLRQFDANLQKFAPHPLCNDDLDELISRSHSLQVDLHVYLKNVPPSRE